MDTNKRLLIVDENFKRMEESLADSLKNRGIDLTVASNGDEAYALISAGKFDLVIVDIGLNCCKDTDWYAEMAVEWVRGIRKRDETVKIIVLNNWLLHDEAYIKAAGADAYFTKPIDWKEYVLKPLGIPC